MIVGLSERTMQMLRESRKPADDEVDDQWTTTAGPDSTRTAKASPYYGIKADYSNIKSRLYDGVDYSGNSLRHILHNRRQKLRMLVTQIMTFNPDKRYDKQQSVEPDTVDGTNDESIVTNKPEKIVYKEKNKYIYVDSDVESNSIKYHPYYKMYAGP